MQCFDFVPFVLPVHTPACNCRLRLGLLLAASDEKEVEAMHSSFDQDEMVQVGKKRHGRYMRRRTMPCLCCSCSATAMFSLTPKVRAPSDGR